MEVITQVEMATEKTLTGEILNALAIKERMVVLQDHVMDETQTIMMMEKMEMIVMRTMMPPM